MTATVPSENVHETLGRYMLADGMPLVFDMEKSHGSWLVDAKTGREFLDLFSFFATNPVGHNHPKLVEGQAAEEIRSVALHKPSNSDVYTPEMAAFVDTFMDVTVPDSYQHAFFISGGALAVENALKAAFDWKVRKNRKAGSRGEPGQKVLHFREAFHGRSGYTLSLTNTHPAKVDHFPKFDWPRVSNPKVLFPIKQHLGPIVESEQRSLQEIRCAFHDNPDDIAAIIIEPIQGEGGDNHFRPEFFRELRDLADEFDAMLIFDEVQTGLGLTGTWWMLEQTGIEPDMVTFGKKTQVCGFFANSRIDEIEENVFHTSSRINSTWGGNLVDMVRARHYINIIEEENLLANTRRQGAFLLDELQRLAGEFPELLFNPRGRGLMCAVTLPDAETRDRAVERLYERNVLMLPCGYASLRVRPSLNVTRPDLESGVATLRDVVSELA